MITTLFERNYLTLSLSNLTKLQETVKFRVKTTYVHKLL